MTNANKSLEVIFNQVAKDAMKGLIPVMEEAIEMELSNRWDDIIDAVIETNMPAQNVVSNEQYDKLINDNIEMDAEIVALRAALIGTSCVLVQAPVVASEPVVRVRKGQRKGKTSMSIASQLKEIEASTVPSMMDEMDKEETEEEKALWADFDEELEAKNDDLPEDTLPMEFQGEAEEEDTFDPFADFNLDNPSDEEVHDALAGTEEFDPFNTNDSSDDDDSLFASEVPDVNMDDIPNFEEEEPIVVNETVTDAPAIPASAPAMPLVNPLGKGDAKMVTYQVFDKEVSMLQSNAFIKNVKDGKVRRMAFDLNTMMAAGNAKSKKSPEEKMMGKFYTQMIREWGLEIAAANNISTIKGDAGAAILVAELFYSLQTNGKLVSPALRFRNDGEREKAAVAYRGMQNPATRSHYMTLVDTYKASFAMEPALFAGDKAQTREQQLQAGYALLHARMSSTWENAAGKTVCVFPEVNAATVKGGAFV